MCSSCGGKMPLSRWMSLVGRSLGTTAEILERRIPVNFEDPRVLGL
jgi:hypothetical protein